MEQIGMTSYGGELHIMEDPGKSETIGLVGATLLNGSTPVILTSASYTDTVITIATHSYTYKGVAGANDFVNGAWALITAAGFGTVCVQISDYVKDTSDTITLNNTITGPARLTDWFGPSGTHLKIVILEFPNIYRQTKVGHAYGPYLVASTTTSTITEQFADLPYTAGVPLGAYAGMFVSFISGPLKGKKYKIVSNTASVITLDSNLVDATALDAITLASMAFFYVIEPTDISYQIDTFDLPSKSEVITSMRSNGSGPSAFGGTMVDGSMKLLSRNTDLYYGSQGGEFEESPLTSTISSIAAVTFLVTTSAPHGLAVGDNVKFFGCSDVANNGFHVVATVPSTTTFTVVGTITQDGSDSGYVVKATRGNIRPCVIDPMMNMQSSTAPTIVYENDYGAAIVPDRAQCRKITATSFADSGVTGYTTITAPGHNLVDGDKVQMSCSTVTDYIGVFDVSYVFGDTFRVNKAYAATATSIVFRRADAPSMPFNHISPMGLPHYYIKRVLATEDNPGSTGNEQVVDIWEDVTITSQDYGSISRNNADLMSENYNLSANYRFMKSYRVR